MNTYLILYEGQGARMGRGKGRKKGVKKSKGYNTGGV